MFLPLPALASFAFGFGWPVCLPGGVFRCRLMPFAERVLNGNASAVRIAPSPGGLVAGQVQLVFIQRGRAWPVVHGRALQGLARGGLLRRGLAWRLLVPPGVEQPADVGAQRGCDGGAFAPDQGFDDVAGGAERPGDAPR